MAYNKAREERRWKIWKEAEEKQLRSLGVNEDDIENQRLYQVLIKMDRLTIQIVLWKMDGYSSIEISEKCGLSVNAINFRVWHLRKKLKNIL